MRHLVLVRSSFGESYESESNQRRLEIAEKVTVASLRSQSHQDWELAVLVDPTDPFLESRKDVFKKVGVKTHFLSNQLTDGRPIVVARAGYRHDWNKDLGLDQSECLTTRLDDDDAFHPTLLERVSEAAKELDHRTALMNPVGYKIWRGSYSPLVHPSNQMHTLYTRKGDPLHVYSYKHPKVRETVPVIDVDQNPSWLWLRHEDTVSACKTGERDFDDDLMDQFAVDWDFIGTL